MNRVTGGKTVSKAFPDIRLSFVLLLFLCVFFQSGHAQDNRAVRMEKLIASLDSTVEQSKSNVILPPVRSDIDAIAPLFEADNFTATADFPKMNMLEAERRNMNKDWGLSLEAGYLQNLEQGVFDSEGIFYNRRYRLGLRWDILDNGWRENQLAARQLRREIQIEKIERQRASVERQYELMRQAIVALLEGEKATVKSHYRNILRMKRRELKELYDMGYKSWDEVLQISAELSQTEMAAGDPKKQYQGDSLQTALLSRVKTPLPVLSLDRDALENAVGSLPGRERADSLRLRNTADRHRPWRDISLSANLNYNYYDRSGQQLQLGPVEDREYFSLGVNVSVPFSVFRGTHKLYGRAHREELDYRNERQDERRLRQIRNYYNDYQQLKEQYTEVYYRYLRQSDTIIKKESKKQLASVEYSPAEQLNLFMTQLETIWQLKDTKEKLYLKLLQIAERVPDLPLSSYAEAWEPPALLDYQDMAGAVYIWSDTFASHSNNFLLNYLGSREFHTVLLSPGKKASPQSEKINDFIEDAQRLGIKVYLMKGSNVIIRKNNRESIAEFVNMAKQYGAAGVHLDVEPHTFDDWEQNREQYLSQYVDMVDYAGSQTDSAALEFTLSIPVYYDSILSVLASEADAVYVMAYGSGQVSDVARRLSDELSVFTGTGCESKLVVALRPEDFGNDRSLREFMTNLDRRTGKKCYALHDLGKLIDVN